MARRLVLALAVLAGALLQTGAQAQRDRQPPYWASINTTRAMMRTGPGRNYPATWLYVRADLPIRVIETYPDWRKVQDPDGTTGWMLRNLLSDTRTAIVRGTEPVAMHEEPDEGSAMPYRAEPGVVGRLSNCGNGWCRLDVGGRRGYVRVQSLWGVDPGEQL
jgi:SH3-like domain-containing protein